MHYALKSIIKMLILLGSCTVFKKKIFQRNIDFIKYKLRIQHILFLEHCVEVEYGIWVHYLLYIPLDFPKNNS